MGANVGPANKLISLNLMHYFRKREIILKDSSQETDRATKTLFWQVPGATRD